MKSKITIFVCSVLIAACNNKKEKTKPEITKQQKTNTETTVNETKQIDSVTPGNTKTAYIDTSRLMKEYNEAKALESKYKAKADEKGKALKAKVDQFKQEASNFQSQAQANGQTWAQQKGAELQKKEQQLAYEQQQIGQELQEQSSKEMDLLVKGVKNFIKDYGKKNGYSYIFGTGETATVLYAEDKYDITNEIIKELNENYKLNGKISSKK